MNVKMKTQPPWSKKQALKYAHSDTTRVREYSFKKDGRVLFGKQGKTYCGHWLSMCEDDPKYDANHWAFNQDDQRPTCPRCVARDVFSYPGMLLIVVSNFGIPMIARIEEDGTGFLRCLVVWGMLQGRCIDVENLNVAAVLKEGDFIEEAGLVVENGELVER